MTSYILPSRRSTIDFCHFQNITLQISYRTTHKNITIYVKYIIIIKKYSKYKNNRYKTYKANLIFILFFTCLYLQKN